MVIQNSGGTVYEYILLHKEIELAIIRILDLVRVVNVEILCSDDEIKHFPLYSINSRNIEWNIEQWLYERSIPCKRISPVATKADALELLLENYGLSLVDHYWIKPIEDRKSTWESVNLYDNYFEASNVINERNKSGTLNPSFSIGGELKKIWMIDSDGKRVLVKWNASDNSRQSVSEVFATLMHKKQGRFPYVDYSLTRGGKSSWNCRCEAFTNSNVEFVSAYDAMDAACRRNDESYYNMFIESCTHNGLTELEVREFLEYQILTDFVITNVDRHFNNFGIMRDSTTLQWLGIAKIFDSGNSMFAGKTYIPRGKELLDIETNSFKSKEMKLLEYVTNPMLVDIGNLPTEEEFVKWYSLSDDADTVMSMYQAYKIKIKVLQDFQRGVKVYKYGYKIDSDVMIKNCPNCGNKLLSTGECSNFNCNKRVDSRQLFNIN